MKLFSKEQIYEGDLLTTKRQNISSTELMERAGVQIFNWLHVRMQGAQVAIHIFCGIGNNGGDGLVVSRHLILHGYNVNTYIVNYSDKRSKDFLINYEKIKSITKKWPEVLKNPKTLPDIHKDDIIIDAIFGIGLNRKPEDWVIAIFKHFKASAAFTLSVDIPSGLYTDSPVEDPLAVVFANFTLSFQSPKLVFFLPETGKYTQQWEVLDIGIDRAYLFETPTEAQLISKFEVLPLYLPREKFSHKGQYGHAVIIGGSYGKIGAVQLAAKATLCVGAGLVTTCIPKCGYHTIQTSLPEAMVITSESETHITTITLPFIPQAVGLGIGLGTLQDTVKAIEQFIDTYKYPLVIDADGLNILAQNEGLLLKLPKQSILTPHPKELERLIGNWGNDFEKLEKVKQFSIKYDCIVVIKGANSITVYDNQLYVNTTGNPGLATAGSGDVLTGVITGLLAQGYSPLNAAVFGVYLHGKSADIAVEDYGYQSLIASRVIDYLGEAYKDLLQPIENKTASKNEESTKSE